MSDSIRLIPADSAEYSREYTNGWNASRRATEGALDRADARNVSHAWYDGYEDYSIGATKWAKRDARLAGDHEPQTMAAGPGDVPRDCRASGGYHKYSDVPRYTTSDGTLLTLGGHVECSHCHDVAHYSELSRGYREAACREAGRTHQGNVSESFALYALEAWGIGAEEAGRMLYQASTSRGTIRANTDVFMVTLTYAGNDSEAGGVFTVAANGRTAGKPAPETGTRREIVQEVSAHAVTPDMTVIRDHSGYDGRVTVWAAEPELEA